MAGEPSQRFDKTETLGKLVSLRSNGEPTKPAIPESPTQRAVGEEEVVDKATSEARKARGAMSEVVLTQLCDGLWEVEFETRRSEKELAGDQGA